MPVAATTSRWASAEDEAYPAPVGAGWKLTIRRGPKVAKSRHPSAEEALRALEQGLGVVPESAPRSVFRREYGPAAQVVARGELRGPGGVRGGVDLRGDGSAEPWTGRLTREVVPTEGGETPHAALGRALAAAR